MRRMAELLRQGATMLADACPQCNSPLLKVGDDIYCAKCNRRIVYATEDSAQAADSGILHTILPELQTVLVRKLEALGQIIDAETDTESLTALVNLMVLLLQSLEKVEQIGH